MGGGTPLRPQTGSPGPRLTLCPALQGFQARMFLSFSQGSRNLNEPDRRTTPSTMPRLTGSLELDGMAGGVRFIARRLLDLPNFALHFTKIVALCWRVNELDYKSATDLASRCSDTPERLQVANRLLCVFPPPYRYAEPCPRRLHLTFPAPQNSKTWCFGANSRPSDRPLSSLYAGSVKQLIRPNVTYVGDMGVSLRDYYARSLLPELTRRGFIDVVQCNPRSGPHWYGGHYVAIVG